MTDLKLSQFDYEFPERLIAKYPLKDRSSSKMMVVNTQTKTIEHRLTSNLPEYFGKDDMLILNNTKVFPARLFGKKKNSGGKVEILLIKEIISENSTWEAMLRSNKKIREGLVIELAEDLEATVLKTEHSNPNTAPIHTVSFSVKANELHPILERIGHTPLPPYIKREDDKNDVATYQTVYAQNVGAAAAPTAGLHFTNNLLNKIELKGTKTVNVTLHVGAGTFLPVEVENIIDHKIHSENYHIDECSFKAIKAQLSSGKPITCVGTTSVRTVETALRNGVLDGSSELYIYPGYEFSGVNKLLTNFHQPKSTLFMLISAFAGLDFMKHCYSEAVKHEYRLFSYGDAMLIL